MSIVPSCDQSAAGDNMSTTMVEKTTAIFPPVPVFPYKKKTAEKVTDGGLLGAYDLEEIANLIVDLLGIGNGVADLLSQQLAEAAPHAVDCHSYRRLGNEQLLCHLLVRIRGLFTRQVDPEPAEILQLTGPHKLLAQKRKSSLEHGRRPTPSRRPSPG